MSDDAALARTSSRMAVGTIASRATGFGRTAVLAYVLGAGPLAQAYNVANTTPNILYELLLGGVLTSVVVPLLVEASRKDSDGGTAYAQRLLSVVALALGAASLLAVALAPWLVDLYLLFEKDDDPAQRDLAVTFARFFLPQIVFYGLGATIGALLNTRGRFGPPMWAPVLNNVVVIVTLLVFVLMPGPDSPEPGSISTAQTAVLGIGTTLGILAMTVALLPALHGTGFRWRFRRDLRGMGLRRSGRLASWMLLYVVANQVSYLIVVQLATSVGDYPSYTYAFVLWQLPHAIVAVSLITALLPRMSGHAVDERLDLVRADLARGARLVAAVLVPAAFAYVVLGRDIATLIFAHGRVSVDEGVEIGAVLAAFAFGLVPFSLFQLQLRAFYAMRDTRTPALVNVAVNAVNIVAALALFAALPEEHRVVGLALGYSASYGAGFAVSSLLLRRRLDGLEGPRTLRTVVRLGLAAALGFGVAAVVAAVLRAALDGATGEGPLTAAVVLVVAGAVGASLFAVAATRMRVAEVAAVTRLVRARLGG